MAEEIVYTMDYERLVDLFVRSGLEISPDDPRPDGLVTCFTMTDEETGQCYGAAGLCFDKGEYILRCVAVEKEFRGYGYGKKLVEAVMKEAKSRKAERIWLTAKVPQFYKKFGFQIIPIEQAPFEVKCLECNQYRNGCESEVMLHVFS